MPSAARFAFFISFCIFIWLSSEGLYLRDSGELTAAAALLGVAHETGFSLYLLLSRLFLYLPLSEIAFRANLVSAVCGALCVAICVAICQTCLNCLGQKGPSVRFLGSGSALLCGALLVADPVFQKSAGVAEVYTPTALSIAIGLLLLYRGAERRQRLRTLLGCSFLLGLSFALHTSLRVVLLPLFLLLLCAIGWQHWKEHEGSFIPKRVPKGLLCVSMVVLGSLLVAYLPIRAPKEPLVSFGDPRDLAGLWAHLSAARIRADFHNEILSLDPAVVSGRLLSVGDSLLAQRGWLSLALSGLGLAIGVTRTLRDGLVAGLFVPGMLALDLVYAVWINPMGERDWQNRVPTAMALSIAAGQGFGWGLGWLRPLLGRFGAVALGVLLWAAVLVPAIAAEGDTKRGLSTAVASRYVRGALALVPPRGALFGLSDDLLAGALYEQGVCGDRPDVVVIARQYAWDARYLGRALSRGDAALVPERSLARFAALPEGGRVALAEAMLTKIIERAPGRIAWEMHPEDGPPQILWERLVPFVPVFTAQSHGAEPLLPGEARSLLCNLVCEGETFPREPLFRDLAARTLLRLAEPLIQKGDRLALGYLDLAEPLSQDGPGTKASVAIARGVVLSRLGDLAGALSAVQAVLAKHPHHVQAERNAALYKQRLGLLQGHEKETPHPNEPQQGPAGPGVRGGPQGD